MKKSQISSDQIIPIGTPYSGVNEYMFSSALIQHALSMPSSPLEELDEHGTPKKSYEEMCARIEKLGGKCIVHITHSNTRYYLWDNSSYVSVSFYEAGNNIGVDGVITDPTLFSALKKLTEEFISEAKNNLVFCIIKLGEELQIKSMGNASSPLIEENYTKEVISDYRYAVSAFKKKPSIGRIVILNGVPGTGKTHLIRSMLSEMDSVFLIVPSNLLEVLDKPEFMPLLLDVKEEHEKPIVMIIEDGDLCLVPREHDNISSIASLLNLSDGILGSMLDVKMIISTNAAIKDMDKAILRPGRLTKQIDVSPLEYKQANEVYNRLCGGTATLPSRKEYTLAEVYEFFNTKDILPAGPAHIKRAIGFGA